MKTETIYGVIPSKSNCYTVGRVNGRPCIVKSNEMKRYERSFIKQCTIYKNRNISTPFRLIVDVYYPDYTHIEHLDEYPEFPVKSLNDEDGRGYVTEIIV